MTMKPAAGKKDDVTAALNMGRTIFYDRNPADLMTNGQNIRKLSRGALNAKCSRDVKPREDVKLETKKSSWKVKNING